MQHVGLIVVLLTILMGLFIFKQWRPVNHRSFSEHVATRRSSQLIFTLFMVPITAVYYWFLLTWLGPHLMMPTVYYVLLVFLLGMQLIVSVVPASKKPFMQIHTAAALVVALGMIAIAILFALFAHVTFWLMVASWLFAVAGIGVMYLYTFVPSSHRHYLTYELSFFGAFWLLIVLLTYF